MNAALRAQPLTQPRTGVRTAKSATRRRVLRKQRAGYSTLARFCGVLLIALTLVMTYVMLTARLTSLNYAVAKAQRERVTLQAQTARLDDQLAALRGDDRLAALAAKFRMGDAQTFALVTLPAPVRHDHSHLAFLPNFASLFGAK